MMNAGLFLLSCLCVWGRVTEGGLLQVNFHSGLMSLAVGVKGDDRFDGTWKQYRNELGGEIFTLANPIRVQVQVLPGFYSMVLTKVSTVNNSREAFFANKECGISFRAKGGCWDGSTMVLCCLGQPLRSLGEHCWANDGTLYSRFRIEQFATHRAVEVAIQYLSPGNDSHVVRGHSATLTSATPAQAIWTDHLVAEATMMAFERGRPIFEKRYDLMWEEATEVNDADDWFFLDKFDLNTEILDWNEAQWMAASSCARESVYVTPPEGILSPHRLNTWANVLQASPAALFQVNLPLLRVGMSPEPSTMPSIRVALVISLIPG